MAWLEAFCLVMSCSERFALVLAEQLTAQAAEQADIDLRERAFFLAPPSGTGIRFDSDNTAQLTTDLVGPDAFGHPVTISWKCERHSEERILPSDPALDCSLRFWWSRFPGEALRDRYALSRNPPWPRTREFLFDPAEFPFAVEWGPFAWPDLWLELDLEGQAANALLLGLETRLERAREEWNRQSRDLGVIHDISRVRQVASDRLEFHVDFGSARKNAIVAVFEALQEVAEQLSLRRIVVRGYSVLSDY